MTIPRTLSPILLPFALAAVAITIDYALSFQGNEFSEKSAWRFLLLVLFALIGLLIVGITNLTSSYPKHRLILHTPVFITSYLIAFYGLPGLAGFFNRELVNSLADLGVLDYVYAAFGWIVLLVGELCLWIGYRLGLSGMTATPPSERPLPSLAPTMGLWFFSIALRVFNISQEGRGFGADRQHLEGIVALFDQTIGYIETAHFLIIIITTLQFLRGRWSVTIFSIIVGFELIFAFTAAFSSQVWFIAIVIAITYIYEKKRIRVDLRTSLLALLLGASVLLVIPVAETLRTMTYSSRSIPSLLEATREAYSQSWGTSFEDSAKRIQEKFMGRQAIVAHMPGIIIKKTPNEIAYRNVNEFILTPLYILPRFIWQDKPILSRGVWFSITYLNYPSTTRSSSAMMMAGEAYMFGGWITVAIAMFSIGMLLAFVYRTTVNRGLPVATITILPAYMHIEGQFTVIFTAIVQTTLVTLFLYWLLMQLTELPRTRYFSPKTRYGTISK
jgi:hypothetical protein